MVAFLDADLYRFKHRRLNLKTIIGTYRELGGFIEAMDAEARARGEPEDQSIDADFRSGVYLGVGCTHLILSLMPGKILAIVELFGYKGDRATALAYLYKIGGWSPGSNEPAVPKGDSILKCRIWVLISGPEHEGVRRSISDMSLLIFHLILSGFTFNGVDIDMAQKILDWNLKRYPNGPSPTSNRLRMPLISGCRRIFPVCSGSDEHCSWPTGSGDSILQASCRCPTTVSKSASHLVLGDSHLQFGPLGHRGIIEMLGSVESRGNCKSLLVACKIADSCSRSGQKRSTRLAWRSAHYISTGKQRRRWPSYSQRFQS